LTRLDEELADAKATAASAIAGAESRERTLTRRVAMLTEECEQLRVTVASAAAVEETEGEESYVAKLTGELALAKAELNEMRAAFELVQEVSDEAVAAEQTLLARVEELEAQVEADEDIEWKSADSDKMAELEDALAAAKTELAAERLSREDTEAALAENIESLEELDVARRRVTELEAQLAAVESAGPVVDPKTAREMDEMKQMIEWQDEQILRAVDGLDKRDAEAKRAAEDAAAKLSDVRALEKRLDELQKVADRSKMMERAFKVQEEEVKDGLGQINALRSDREIAEQEVETLRAKLADLEASRPAALPTQSVTDTDAIRTKLEAAEAAVAAKQAELERTNADAAAARAEAERRMAAVVQRFSDDLIAKSDELEKRVEAVFASEEKAAAAFAEELARNAAMLGEKDDETAALVAAVNSLEDEADDYRENSPCCRLSSRLRTPPSTTRLTSTATR
jgi:chromosome segregation ATPase